jgi:hypothetical protein
LLDAACRLAVVEVSDGAKPGRRERPSSLGLRVLQLLPCASDEVLFVLARGESLDLRAAPVGVPLKDVAGTQCCDGLDLALEWELAKVGPSHVVAVVADAFEHQAGAAGDAVDDLDPHLTPGLAARSRRIQDVYRARH